VSYFYDSKFDLDFKQSFSSSYVNFNDDEINNMALKILSELTKESSRGDQKFLNSLKNKKIHQNLINQSFKVNQRYSETETNYWKSNKLLDLFNSASELRRISDNNVKKKIVFSRLKRSSHDKDIKRYAKKENIPLEFALLSSLDDCIKNLVGFFLKKHLSISFNTEILDSCKNLSSRWQSNIQSLTPYERTGEFQKYVYSICNKHQGSELNIPSKLMRIILSTARLHFTIMDEMNLNPSDLLVLLKKQTAAANNEYYAGYSNFYNNDSVPRMQNKKYVPNWRKRHLMPFVFESDDLYYILQLNETDPMFDVKLALLDSRLLTSVEVKKLCH
jgi:hypothetical protein